ncbi:MAG: tetraacyldisaccharide 4'-kinase [Candidatus Poribacteria bacterium]|nr:tetraacyldisaccharide 4'-kinase [Candidatus Poribacteria bacterium]
MRLTHTQGFAWLQQRILATPLRFLLIPLSWFYTAGVHLRNILYTRRVFKARKLPCRVISVGNIVVGGTGKTPAVIAIAKHLQREGMRVAILLRGYKRRVREKVTIVSDGEKVCASAIESGDEAQMMARYLSGVPILVGKCRYLAGRVAIERFKVDVLLLDDGFQHRQLARDVDILTIPVTHPFGSPEKLLPAGTLREPPSALKRADLILLTHADIPDVSTHIKKLVKSLAPNALVLESIHQPIYCYPLVMEAPAAQETFSRQFSAKRFSFNARKHPSKNPLFQPRTDNREPTTIPPRTDTYDIKALKGKRVLAVCGIGNPNAFVATLRRCAVARVELLEFPDHHVYTETDKQHIYTAFQETGADLIVTTQKDEQKLADVVGETGLSSPYGELPIVVLAVALVITEGDAAFTDVLLGAS